MLASNLVLTGGTDAINVKANYVSINLNGFSNVGSVAEEAPAGILCYGCLISGNIANHNYKGIVNGSGSLVFGNSASGNVYGLDLNPNAGYGKNVMENNGSACVNPTDGGASMGDNICNGVLE
jgi:parallel beta-helix repeat protein